MTSSESSNCLRQVEVVHREQASSSVLAVGTPHASCGLFLPSSHPYPFAGAQEGGAWQLWDQKSVFSLWLGPDGCPGSWLSPVGGYLAHHQTAGS